jgi:peroxiredoxin
VRRIAAALLVLWALGACSREDAQTVRAEPAPDFELPLLGGGSVMLSSLRGKTVLLDFWATWCEPCVLQVPELNVLWRERHRGPYEVLGIAVDIDGAAEVGPWVEENRVEYPVLLGDESLAFDFGAMGFPSLVVVRPDGSLGAAHLGVATREDLEELLRR